MIYLNQNLFTKDRQNVRENCNLFNLIEQIDNVLTSIYQDFSLITLNLAYCFY